jgi:hypothetical protein
MPFVGVHGKSNGSVLGQSFYSYRRMQHEIYETITAMKNAPAFNAIASRDFVIVKPDGSKIPVHVAIGAPYRPAKHARAGNKVGCLVLTCDDPDLATEIWGSDEMDVVAIALALIDIHLIQMIKETGGELQNLAGAPVDPSGSEALKETRAILRKTMSGS